MTGLLRWLGLGGATTVESVEQWAWRAAEHPPLWMVVAAAGLGVALAAINWLPHLAMRPRLRLATFALRLGMAGIVMLALYRVELALRLQVRKPQLWRVLLDDSASMQTADVAGRTRFDAALQDLAAIRGAADRDVRLEVATLSGASVGLRADHGTTHLYAKITEQALQGAPIDRLVVLTDGRDVASHDFGRLGRDLHAANVAFAARVYGSTQQVAAAAVFAEPDREMIRLGEDLIIYGSIVASTTNATYPIRLMEDGEEVMAVAIPKRERDTFKLAYRPEKEGLHQYTLQLQGEAGPSPGSEASFMASVTPEKIRVLLIEGFPRYEFKFMRYVLDSDPMVELVSISHLPGGGVYVQGEPLHANPEQGLIDSRAELFKYDVVILRDVPRTLFRAGGDMSESRMRLLAAFVEDRGGGLIMGGGSEVYRAGGYEDSPLAAVIPFDLGTTYGTEPQFPGKFLVAVNNGLYDHPILRLLPDPAANRERWRDLRELDGCNNVGRPRPLATTLLSRRIEHQDASGETVERSVPVLVYQPFGEGKVIAAAVDTSWRWQLQPDFDEPPLQTLLANMVRYVAPPPARAGEPNIRLKDRAPRIGSEAVLYTELRDEQYQPLRRADLVVTVTHPDGRVERMYPRDQPNRPGYYEYRVALEQGGRYGVVAESGKHKQATSFIAGAARDEYADLAADPEAMAALADAAGGELITATDDWIARTRSQPLTETTRRVLPVWNSPLALILFITAVALDCYLRKRQGLA